MNRLFQVTRVEQAWARDVFETIFPGRVPREVERFVRDTVEGLPRPAGVGFRAAVAAVTFAPLVLERRRALLSSLDSSARLRVLQRFADSDLYLARSIFTLLKATAALACATTSGSRS